MPKKAQPLSSTTAQNQEKAVHQIVTCTHRHVEVLASPGSGKTHTLLLRLQYLLNQAVLPQQILVLSFSNEAVRELHRRMDLACTTKAADKPEFSNSPLSKIRISTCHSFANSLLREAPALMTETLQRKLLTLTIKSLRRDMRIRKIWADVSLTTRQRRRAEIMELLDSVNLRRLLSLLDYARAANISTKDAITAPQFAVFPAGASVVREVSRRYRELKRQNASMDYADMLHKGVQKLLTGKADTPYTHVLVDEFQDCSASQIKLLAALARTSDTSVMVLGDPLQAIYRFAGAQYQGLSAHLENVVTLHLPVSHRLTAQTAALASAIAKHNSANAIQTRRTGVMPLLITNTSQTAQARQVLADIQELTSKGADLQEIAVLARTKDMLRPVEAELLRENIVCQRVGSNRDHRHVLNVLRMVKWLLQWKTNQQPIEPKMLVVLGFADHKIDADKAAKEAKTLMTGVASITLEGQYVQCSKSYLRLLGGLRQNPEIHADVNRWTQYCRNFKSTQAMRLAIKRMPSTNITTATIHAAKGREWKHVFVVGATDGVLPIYKAKDIAAQEEERNILYVAVSRAKESLRIYHAPTQNSRVRQLFEKPSRFLRTKQVAKCLQHQSGILMGVNWPRV